VVAFKDATVEAVEKKLSKQYQANGKPIELLAYYLSHPGRRATDWRDALRRVLDARLATSSFRRVWVFSFYEDAVTFEYPNALHRRGTEGGDRGCRSRSRQRRRSAT
jgi:hypothetical protein